VDWDSFAKAITEYYQPTNAVVAARDHLARLAQRTTVKVYVDAFKDIAINIPNMTNDEKLDRFKRGLKQDVRLHVAFANPATFEDAVHVAMQIDDILYSHRRDMSYRSPPSSTSVPNGPTPMDLGNVETKRHALNDKERQELRRKGACFYCREPGHVALHCPKKSKTPSGNVMPRP
jgi:hypothetical protein